MTSQKLDRGGRIVNSLCLIQALIKRKCLVPIWGILVAQFDTALLPPEQVRAQRDKAMRRIPVSHTAHICVDTKNLLQHDDSRPRTAWWDREVGVEFASVE